MGNTKATARIKEQRAIALRLQGKTFEQIAQEIGYADRASAYMRVMNAIRRETVDDIAGIRELELARIDALWERAFVDALAGDNKAQLVCVKLMERRSRFLGLDHANGIMERAVRVEEAKFEMLADLLSAALDRAGLNATQAKEVQLAVAEEVRARLPSAS